MFESDDSFTYLVVILVVLGVLGTIVRWAIFIFSAKRTFDALRRNLDQQIPDLQRMIQLFSTLPPGQRPQMQAAILGQFGHMQSQMNQLEGLRRQQYEVKVGELQGMAASAGLDWTPPSY